MTEQDLREEDSRLKCPKCGNSVRVVGPGRDRTEVICGTHGKTMQPEWRM